MAATEVPQAQAREWAEPRAVPARRREPMVCSVSAAMAVPGVREAPAALVVMAESAVQRRPVLLETVVPVVREALGTTARPAPADLPTEATPASAVAVALAAPVALLHRASLASAEPEVQAATVAAVALDMRRPPRVPQEVTEEVVLQVALAAWVAQVEAPELAVRPATAATGASAVMPESAVLAGMVTSAPTASIPVILGRTAAVVVPAETAALAARVQQEAQRGAQVPTGGRMAMVVTAVVEVRPESGAPVEMELTGRRALQTVASAAMVETPAPLRVAAALAEPEAASADCQARPAPQALQRMPALEATAATASTQSLLL